MDHAALTARLEALLQETCALWEPGWVTFNWRGYTYDHVQRVRGLAVALCRAEGGDPLVTELAALLHDLTKPYDGEYLTDAEGKRLVDALGFWRNEVRPPVGHNHVTALYENLNLAGSLHNESGATLAEALLSEWGVEPALVARVAGAIRHHLIPPADAPIESACLYDADTIDANIGLPALVRNIYINLHFYDQRRQPGAPDIATVLTQAPLDFLRPYITDNLPRWNAGKHRDFVPKLLTQAGQSLAVGRVARLDRMLATLADDLPRFATGADHSTVDVVLHYMRHSDEPSIAAETAYLTGPWLHGAAPPPTRELLACLQLEMAGEM
jgi:HD superfamily phosphohydrolase YqeK